ncbi:unnamed protein product [Spirodela intermedia]|uniref:Amine oxidase domain-containing protein n=1 Tax=Spirodela intermedia TaxID=51605 RepID=A0A7I8IMK9_SPIIN|nr:unnamed protein product [Spirodela intermedia]CAA6658783.1 unnamed protein product [Spirodela intermedia]
MISLSPPPNAAPSEAWRRLHRHGRSVLRCRSAVVRTFATSSPSSSSPSAVTFPPPSGDPPRAVVIGAGLAGLAAATRLHAAGVPVVVLEWVGGRVRTDAIFITAYPEARKVLDYAALDLQKFYSGALVYAGGGRFHRVADPLRHPLDGVGSLLNPVGTVPDKLLVGLARFLAAARDDEEILAAEEVAIIDRLRAFGFTDSIVDRFFRPFFGGVFFDRELETTSRLFDFVFKCLALGDNTLPSGGIGDIAEQLASRLPRGPFDWRRRSLARRAPPVGGGAAEEALRPAAPPEHHLPVLHGGAGAAGEGADPAPERDGEGAGEQHVLRHQCLASYAPPGKTLVSVSLIGTAAEEEDDGRLAAEVAAELGGWFGAAEVAGWRHLRTYRIPFAQPDQSPQTELTAVDPRAGGGVYLCGDHMRSATFDGALVSGRVAAEALIGDRFPSGKLLPLV